MTDENYIYDVIRSTCIQHQASNLINDFHYHVYQSNSCQQRFVLRFFNELPSYFDIPLDEQFQDSAEFHVWLTKCVRNHLWDVKAVTPFSQIKIDPPDHSMDAIDAVGFYIQNGRANGKTEASEREARKILSDLSGLPENADMQKHAQAIIFGKLPITNNMNEKGKSTMAMTEGIKITTERYMSESEARYDAELKSIENKLQQDISNAQFEAQKARCDLENWFRAERIKEQESDKALKRKAYYDGLIASGFTEDQALKILLEDL